MTLKFIIAELSEHTYLYERIMKVTANGLTCRVWVALERERESNSFDLGKHIADVLVDLPGTTLDKVNAVARIDGINSAEIVDKDGFGVCVHKDWP